MPTLTIEVPDATYRAALAFTPQERMRLVSVTFAAAEATLAAEPDYDRETSEDDLEAIGRGLQAEAEGRTIPGDVLFARLKEQAQSGIR